MFAHVSCSSLTLALIPALVPLDPGAVQDTDVLAESEELMSALFASFGDKDKKYAALSKEIEREAAKLEKGDGQAAHPWRLLVAELAGMKCGAPPSTPVVIPDPGPGPEPELILEAQ